jgi:hypothetical protein
LQLSNGCFNWGTDAETFGNFIILASGVVANCPSSSNESPVFALCQKFWKIG